ncbi:MAG: regulatory signaling modulator protein AmpE [Pseudomonadales bacterium]|nr:regulatory signaling modulator protein AmpE [Pseudomonadales bacterium]
MKFLAVLILVFFERNWFGGNPVREVVPFGAYMRFWQERVAAPNVRYLLAVGVPVLVTFFIGVEIRHWFLGLLWLALSVAILIYAIDLDDIPAEFDEHSAWLHAPGDGVGLADAVERQEEFRVDVLTRMFQSLYPALFWFLFFGPAGALFYTLSRQYQDRLEDDDPELDLVLQVTYWMEWPVVRVTGLLFAIVGNFGRCFETWLSIALDVRESTGTVLIDLAEAAVDEVPYDHDDLEDFATASDVANGTLRDLMSRTIFGWLGVAALVVILG